MPEDDNRALNTPSCCALPHNKTARTRSRTNLFCSVHVCVFLDLSEWEKACRWKTPSYWWHSGRSSIVGPKLPHDFRFQWHMKYRTSKNLISFGTKRKLKMPLHVRRSHAALPERAASTSRSSSPPCCCDAQMCIRGEKHYELGFSQGPYQMIFHY